MKAAAACPAASVVGASSSSEAAAGEQRRQRRRLCAAEYPAAPPFVHGQASNAQQGAPTRETQLTHSAWLPPRHPSTAPAWAPLPAGSGGLSAAGGPTSSSLRRQSQRRATNVADRNGQVQGCSGEKGAATAASMARQACARARQRCAQGKGQRQAAAARTGRLLGNVHHQQGAARGRHHLLHSAKAPPAVATPVGCSAGHSRGLGGETRGRGISEAACRTQERGQ